ncbi:hypothetical protein NFI96_002455, partial [Prochilodus magdalenae]
KMITGEHCHNTYGSYYCLWVEYHACHQTGRCRDINECLVTRPCPENSTCKNTIGSYEYINECLVTRPCPENSTCKNTIGSYECVCLPGYQKHNTSATCTDINECLVSSPCPENLTCKNTLGSYECVCLPGYQKHNTSATCTDTDECGNAPPVCGSHASCNNTPGGFTCACHLGFKNQGNSSTPCEDIDECESEEHKCGEKGKCLNLPGTYNCTCDPGYSNFGNTKTKCTELKCNRGHTTTKQAVMDDLLDLFKSSCESLSRPDEQHESGETLLKNLMTVSSKVASTGKINDRSTLSTFLTAMEDTLSLIGPQLNNSRTIIRNDMSEACLDVKKDETPPEGSVSMNTEGVHLNINWKSVVGEHYPGFAYVALVSYKNLSHSNTAVLNDQHDKGRNASYQLNSQVVTALVSNPKTENLPEPVTLTFKYLQDEPVSERTTYTCVYWDETQDGGMWSQKGNMIAEFNSTHGMCTWSHLSSFAILMALYPVENTFELVLITRIGLSLSLICLLVCILTFCFCRSIKGTRTTIHLHLCLCLFIADFLFLFFISSTNNEVGCAVVAGLLHFFFLSAFCWMLLEGVQLYRMVVLVFHTTLRPLYLFAVGYGIPLAIVIISAIANPKGYGTTSYCWLSLEDDFIWSFFAPVCIIIVLNSFSFVITVWKLAEKFSSLNPDISKLKKLRVFVVTAVAQLCVLGGMWVFGCFMFQKEGTVVMLYLFTVLNSLQGVLIFFMHCLMSKQIREEYNKLCGGICRPQKRYSEFSSNQTTNSQCLVGSVLWAVSCGQCPVSTAEGLEDDQHCTVQQQMSYRL